VAEPLCKFAELLNTSLHRGGADRGRG
jgi:hypothetical protein